MGKIRILPDNIANKIAAGEVVERPASAVKEMVENALDAGAGRIRVDVEAGGRKLLRVTDDGCGMVRDDALLAFERHATSKLRTADDLLSVQTLGFRGEALPSIAAVSRLVLETRASDEPAGTRVEINGGRMVDVRDAGLPPGTSVTVRDLFYNIPARRKFLRSETTELAHVASLVTHYALAHPDRHFVLGTSTGELLNVTPVAGHRERLFQVFGGDMLDQLVELGTIETEFAPPPPVSAAPAGFAPRYARPAPAASPPPEVPRSLRLSGFISRPQVQKPRSDAVYIFANRRLIRDRLVLHAIREAYRNLIPPNMFPMALLFLDIPFEEVDVNVHPAKVEVRFRHQAFVHDFVRDALKQRLAASRPVSTFPVAAPSVLEPLPVLQQAAAPGTYGAPTLQAAESHPAGNGGAFRLAPAPPPPEPGRFKFSGAPPIEVAGARPAFGHVPAFPPEGNPPQAGPAAAAAAGATLDDAAGETLDDDAGTVSVDDAIAALRPLGQIQESFIVAAGDDALWIIDQHVAHERILFEKTLRLRSAGRTESQRLLLPRILQIAPHQQAALADIRAELESNGFEIEPFGRNTMAVKAAPSGIAAADVEQMLRDLLDGVEASHCTTMQDARSRVAASIACHAAIKVNTPLDPRKMQWLIDALARTESPMSCPHGRPVLLKYPVKDILKAFHRL